MYDGRDMTEFQEQESRVMTRWRALPGCQRLPLALWLVCGGLIGLALSTTTYRILFMRQVLRLQDHSYSDSQAIWDTLELYSKIFPLLHLVATAVVIAGLMGLARAPRQHMADVAIWALLAAGASGLVLLGDALPWFGSTLLKEHALNEIVLSEPIRVMMILLGSTADALLVVVLARMARAIRAPLSTIVVALAGLWITWNVGFSFYRLLREPGSSMSSDSPWVAMLTQLGPWVAGLALLAYMAARVARALSGYSDVAPPESAREPGALSSPIWDDTASGLELYASGLMWRLGVTITGYALLMVGLLSRSTELTKLILWALAVATIATSLVMLTGIRRYSRQPDESPGHTAASLAFVLMLGGVLLDIYAFVLIIQATSADTESYSAIRQAREAAERADALSVWGMAVGFTSLLILLFSFAQVARHIDRGDLSQRAAGLAVFVALVSLIVIGFRVYLPDARVDIESVIGMAFLVVITALIAVVTYIRLVAALAAAVREARSFGDLPAARVM
jgi:hypothetical protein